MNRPVVIDDQNSPVRFGLVSGAVDDGVHAAFLSSTTARIFGVATRSGSSRVKVAPRPGPSLSARRAPPISCTASTPECRPNPCPSVRVVNPCAKILVRFSAGIPGRPYP